MKDILPRALALQDQLRAWRRHFHQHPELGFEEKQTARYVAGVLTELGVRGAKVSAAPAW